MCKDITKNQCEQEKSLFYGSSDISRDAAVVKCVESQCEVPVVSEAVGVSFHHLDLVVDALDLAG